MLVALKHSESSIANHGLCNPVQSWSMQPCRLSSYVASLMAAPSGMQVLRKLGHLEASLQDLNQAVALLVAPNSMRAFALEQRGSVRVSLKDFQV